MRQAYMEPTHRSFVRKSVLSTRKAILLERDVKKEQIIKREEKVET